MGRITYYAFRHGETEKRNSCKRFNGHKTRLTEVGVDQARDRREMLLKTKFVAGFHSPIPATYETLNIIANCKKCLHVEHHAEFLPNVKIQRDVLVLEAFKKLGCASLVTYYELSDQKTRQALFDFGAHAFVRLLYRTRQLFQLIEDTNVLFVGHSILVPLMILSGMDNMKLPICQSFREIVNLNTPDFCQGFKFVLDRHKGFTSMEFIP